MFTVHDVLLRLRGARRCGSGWIAHCPAHDDRKPSLSVAEVGGRVLLHCFAGCSYDEILRALGLAREPRDYISQANEVHKQTRDPLTSFRRAVEEWAEEKLRELTAVWRAAHTFLRSCGPGLLSENAWLVEELPRLEEILDTLAFGDHSAKAELFTRREGEFWLL